MDFDKLFPGRFMKATDFNGKDVTLTISGVVVEELEGERKKEVKGLISFKETTKALVLNKTNGLCLKAMFGRETDAWVGKRVTLWPAPIQFEDNDIAIRVRGSPDIAAPVTFTLKLAKKKPREVTLAKTGPLAQGLTLDPAVVLAFGVPAAEKGTPIAELVDDALSDAIKRGTAQLAGAKPGSTWVPTMRANLAALQNERVRRNGSTPAPVPDNIPDSAEPGTGG